MIFFPPLRIRRFTAQMHELTIGQALQLAAFPSHLDEMATTFFLRAAVDSPTIDPALWTVQERMMGIAHYLSCTLDDAPDFAVGDGASRFTDYFIPDAIERKSESSTFELEGDTWRVVNLLGRYAEAIERLSDEIKGFQGRAYWLLGMMASTLLRKGEDAPDDTAQDAEVDAWMLERMQAFAALPESVFFAMHSARMEKSSELTHLFKLHVDESGIIVLPAKEDAGKPPARFPVRSTLTEWTRRLCG